MEQAWSIKIRNSTGALSIFRITQDMLICDEYQILSSTSVNIWWFLLLPGYTYSTKTMESHLKPQFPAPCMILHENLVREML